MVGVSYYLAIIQWLTAATQPPHLAAMNAWERGSDLYRDFAFHSGMPEPQFDPWWHEGVLFYKTKVEDTVELRDAHPLWDAYWETKRGDCSKITVPAYVVASWSDHGLHSRGTLEAFKALGSEQKWLEIHGRKKWGYPLRRPGHRPSARLLRPPHLQHRHHARRQPQAQALTDPFDGCHMGVTAENVAADYHVSRDEQDAHAAESHRRAAAATAAGYFAEQITPVEVPGRKGTPYSTPTSTSGPA